MKANEFVKENGIEKCKRILDDLTEQGHAGGFYEELKRLVESHEFINECGGLEHVKNLIATKLHWFDVDAIIKTNQAIADVESCQ